MKSILDLQNGSDVRGVALPGFEDQSVTLTPAITAEIAAAFARWLSEKTGKDIERLDISVGTDSRLSAETLKAAVLSGLRQAGSNGADCGMASTPAMFMSTRLAGCDFDGAIMITASHLPWNRNGLKFFSADGGLDKKDITHILESTAGAASLPDSENPCVSRSFDIMGPYCAHLRDVIRDGIADGETPLSGFKIGVDAGNGAGGFFAEQILKPLGADISASQFLEPDGNFPNHVPNPENSAAMAAAQKMVLDGHCDLGIIFDTDVDRAGAVGHTGEEFSRNRLIGLLAAIEAREHPGGIIVTDSVTSDQLSEFITGTLKCVHHRFKRGYKNVINECIRLNREGKNSPLAIETSGHCAYAENYFLDDGAYLSAKLIVETARLRKEGRILSDLIRDLKDPLEAAEYRLRIQDDRDVKAYGSNVLEALEKYAKSQSGWIVAAENYEGLRVSLPACRGWFLLRMSLHDPLMPLNIESDIPDGVKAIAAELKPFLDECEGLQQFEF